MAHVTTGLRRILEVPFVYDSFQALVGANRAKRRLIHEFLRPFPGALVLDLGCGTGDVLDHIPPSTDYVGIDINEKYIQLATSKYKERGRFYCVRADAIAETDGIPKIFDLILARGLLHHLEDDEVDQLFEASLKHLKPGGHMVCYDPAYVAGQSFLTRFLMSRDRGQCIRTEQAYIELASRHFAAIEGSLHHMTRMPFTQLILRMSNP